jgi:septal ring factor EnvC (AmiA/AmiB activator)
LRNSSGNCAGADLDDEIFEVVCDTTWEGAMSPKTVIPYAPKQKSTDSETDILDRAGNAILDFVKHAGKTTETELREAREAAEYLADQLRAANDQINDLEAEVRRHQARADRAEDWLREISSEIEHRSARRLGFLRMSG